MKPIIAVIHNAVTDESLPDERDVLVQAESISEAMATLGYQPVVVPCGLNLNALGNRLGTLKPLAAFNLVESLSGSGRLIHVVPGLLDALNIPYSGCTAEAIYATSHKVMAKERLRMAGLPTADWINPIPAGLPWFGSVDADGNGGTKDTPRLWIIKSLWEHASLGLESDNLVTATGAETSRILRERRQDLGGACFAEAFIHGREFNLSLLDSSDGPNVLPPAEIRFLGQGDSRPVLVGYKAKWDPESDEFSNTMRSFDFPESDRNLIRELENLALKCWHLFGLKGYARVDFRVDDRNRPFILEINANPCISPDAGFAAALERSGIGYTEGVARIIRASFHDTPVKRQTDG